ncbi:MAG: reactivating factor for ethanolamine ammonia lyase [Chloroflexi bacterium]|nr:reactivating factor for ethanolamine ammonia lyase [Chloroflexota bacterium]
MPNEYREPSYHRWMREQGVPIIEGHGVTNLHGIELGPWERIGGRGAFVDLQGMEGLTGMYVTEIPPGGSLTPERHIYDELIYVLSGRGSTRVWSGPRDGAAGGAAFEWEAGALFAPPLNCWHQIYNLSGDEPARFMAVTLAPLVMDIFHNTRFIFDSEFVFDDRFDGRSDYFEMKEPEFFEPVRTWLWETNLIPDARGPVLKEGEGRMGAGGWGMSYQMGGNILVGHIAEWPVGKYRKAHYHEGGAVILITAGQGYTLTWPKALGVRPFESGHGDQVIRIDWHEGSVVSPAGDWFHQHFNTGQGKVRQVALRLGSKRYGVHFADLHVGEGMNISTRDNGTLIEYEDEDTEIGRMYRDELARAGVEYQMAAAAR